MALVEKIIIATSVIVVIYSVAYLYFKIDRIKDEMDKITKKLEREERQEKK